MSIEENLLKILSKSELNGFVFRDGDNVLDNIKYMGFGRFSANFTTTHTQEDMDIEDKSSLIFHMNEVLFNHNFAKAFFGDNEVCTNCNHNLKGSDWKKGECSNCGVDIEGNNKESWKYNLQQMVLEQDVIKYLLSYV